MTSNLEGKSLFLPWRLVLNVTGRNPFILQWGILISSSGSHSWRGHSSSLWLRDFLLVKADKQISMKITLVSLSLWYPWDLQMPIYGRKYKMPKCMSCLLMYFQDPTQSWYLLDDGWMDEWKDVGVGRWIDGWIGEWVELGDCMLHWLFFCGFFICEEF